MVYGKIQQKFCHYPQSDHTIKTYSDYKIKYFDGHTGRKTESALDFHLKCGVDSEHLIRIYYLHDDNKKLIVIGSMPEHLPTMNQVT